MPFKFAAPGSLSHGRQPKQVPPPAGAMVSPAANELPGLMQVAGDNLHLQGTMARPGVSAQVEPLSRPIDPSDLEAMGAIADPTKLGPMATRADVRTQTMDSPQQAAQRLMQMDTNRGQQQLQTEMHTAGSLVQAVTGPQQAQQMLGQQRLMNQQMAQATGQDMTGALADAQGSQARAFSARYRLDMLKDDPRSLAALDNLAGRMASGGSVFAIGA